jgi:hypothetical protein
LAEAHAVSPGRLEILGAGKPGHRTVTITVGFAGRQDNAARQPDIAAP